MSNKKGISVREFIGKYNNAPFDYQELAEIASDINDHELGKVAKRLIKAHRDFEESLDEIGFEYG